MAGEQVAQAAGTDQGIALEAALQFLGSLSMGDVLDAIAASPEVAANRDASVYYSVRLGNILELVGEDKAKSFLEEEAAKANYNADYEYSGDKVNDYWVHQILIVLAFAFLSMIYLEFIDRDKR